MKELKKIIEDYQKSLIQWAEFAQKLDEIGKTFPGDIYQEVQKSGINKRYFFEMIRAYSFIKMKYPALLKEKITGKPRNIVYLPKFCSIMEKAGETQEEIDKVVMAAVITGSPSCEVMIQIARTKYPNLVSQKKSKDPFELEIEPESKRSPIQRHNDLMTSFVNVIQLLHFLIEECSQNMGIESLREQVGARCHDLAMKLDGIFDPEVFENNKKRKEVL